MASDSTSTTTKTVTSIVYVLLNLVLVASGIHSIHAIAQLKDDGWGDTMRSFGHAVEIVPMLIAGYVYIVVGVLGAVGGAIHWKLADWYELIYYVLIVLFLAADDPVTVLMRRGNRWKRKAYPADKLEVGVRANFDKLFCDAHANYLCNEIPMSEAAAIFLPDQLNSTQLVSFATLKGIHAICRAISSSVPSSLATVCESCAATAVKTFPAVLDWSDDKCPRSNSTMLWCGNYLAAGNDTAVAVGVAPYTACRLEVLAVMKHLWTTEFFTLLAVVVACCLVVSFPKVFNALCKRIQRRPLASREAVEA